MAKFRRDLIAFFADNAQIVDVHGRRWKYDEIAANSDQLFVPYAKKNASYVIEETPVDSDGHLGRGCVVEERAGGQHGTRVDAPNDRGNGAEGR